MQKAPSPVPSGGIAPAVAGPDKDVKDVYVFAGLVLLLALVIGAFWFYSQPEQTPATASQQPGLTGSQVSDALKRTAAVPSGEGAPEKDTAVQKQQDVIHTDLYFEVGRRGLSDEAKAVLAEQAGLLTDDADYGVLVQGYTDQQGSASFNRKLGLQRADKVKEHLIGLGVAEHRIRTVTLGEEGVLCADTSDLCRHMNRRVHLEIRKIGAERMTPPAPAADTQYDGLSPVSTDLSNESDTAPESVVPAAGAGSDASEAQ